MVTLFRDLEDKEWFTVDGVSYVKGRHPAYQSETPKEIPPNAHRARAPYLYFRFDPSTPVTRARAFRELPEGEPFTVKDVRYVKGQHPEYNAQDIDDQPPNAHRANAPDRYVRFGPDTVVG